MPKNYGPGHIRTKFKSFKRYGRVFYILTKFPEGCGPADEFKLEHKGLKLTRGLHFILHDGMILLTMSGLNIYMDGEILPF